jgi:hypothetical protein
MLGYFWKVSLILRWLCVYHGYYWDFLSLFARYSYSDILIQDNHHIISVHTVVWKK